MNNTHYALFNSKGDLIAIVRKDFPAKRMVRAVEDEYSSIVQDAYLSFDQDSESFFDYIDCEDADIPFETEINYRLEDGAIVAVTIKPAWEY